MNRQCWGCWGRYFLWVVVLFSTLEGTAMAGTERRMKLEEETAMTLGESVKLGTGRLTLESVSPAMSGMIQVPGEKRDPYLGYFSATFVFQGAGGPDRRSLDPGKSEDFGHLRISVREVDGKAHKVTFRVEHVGFTLTRLLAYTDKTEELYKPENSDFARFLKKMTRSETAPFLIRRVYRHRVTLPISGESVAQTEYYFVKPGKGEKVLMIDSERLDTLFYGATTPTSKELAFGGGA